MIAHSVFDVIPNSLSLPSFRVSSAWQLSAVKGNELELVGKYQYEVRILGHRHRGDVSQRHTEYQDFFANMSAAAVPQILSLADKLFHGLEERQRI